MDDSKIFIVGANGQLGTELQIKYPNAQKADIAELDITNQKSVEAYDWSRVATIINAAAYTNVDGAETPQGRVAAWNVNATAVGYLVQAALKHDITMLHISTDYVFDGTKDPHLEDELFSPLNVYGASKAAGDLVLSNYSKHYILRTSFVIGEGKNFVRIMLGLGKKGVNPAVIADQKGRITFTNELVRAIDHLLSQQSGFGTYNISNGGEPGSWADVTREIFKLAGMKNTVTNTTTAKYYKDRPEAAARPLNSVLDMTKIEAAGFKAKDWREELKGYVKKELAK